MNAFSISVDPSVVEESHRQLPNFASDNLLGYFVIFK